MGGITLSYIIRRFGMFLLTVWIGATLIFIIPRLAPGDPVAAMIQQMLAQGAQVENSAEIIEAWRARFGLDGPMYIQYLNFLRNAVTFDLGYSLANFPAKVEDLVASALPWTLGLLTIAVIISFVLGNIIGALLAWRRTPALAKAILPITLMLTAIPSFMAAILFLYLFAFNDSLGTIWNWISGAEADLSFPVSKAYGRRVEKGFNLEFIQSVIYHGTLPALVTVFTTMGFWALGMRGMMITNDGEDYMILAEAKGLHPRRIFWRYGMRNSILPQVTALALGIGGIIGGSILVEYIFSYPGTGYLLYQGILRSDYTMIQGIVFLLIVATSAAVLIIDLIYPLIDPRITYEKG